MNRLCEATPMCNAFADFTSEFKFSNGAFSVADSGFTVDMAALDRRLTPQPHDNMYSDMYEYSFRKVL